MKEDIGIKINLDAEEAYEIRIDLGQLKDYTTKRTYRYGKLIEEEIRCK